MKRRLSSIFDRIKTGFTSLVQRGRASQEAREKDANLVRKKLPTSHSFDKKRKDAQDSGAERVVLAQLLAAKAFKIGATIVQRSQGTQLLPQLKAKIAELDQDGGQEAASLACFCHLVLAEVFRNSFADSAAADHLWAAEAIPVEPSPFTYFKIVLERFVESPPGQGTDLAKQACEILKVRMVPSQAAVDALLHRTLLDMLKNGVRIPLPTRDFTRRSSTTYEPAELDQPTEARVREQRQIAAARDARESAQRHREDIEAAVKAEEIGAKVLNDSRKFDLLLFDLDDTLLNSGNLEEFRGNKNLNNSNPQYLGALKEAATGVSPLIPEDSLLRLKESFPDLRLGVFTRSPRQYAKTLLNQFFPEVAWDCIVAFEDVSGRTKPAPDGVYFAAKKFGISDLSRVAVIGDQSADIASAYQAGSSAVLFTMAWEADWKYSASKRDRYDSIGFMPDSIIQSANSLLKVVTAPHGFMPALEAAEVASDKETLPNPFRVDSKNYFNNFEGNASAPLWVTVFSLGRYFPANPTGSKYDFSRKGHNHRVSERLLLAKDGVPYPESWVFCTASYLKSFLRPHISWRRPIVVCSIPSGGTTGIGSDRLKQFLDRLASFIGNDEIVFDSDVLSFRDGIRSNKSLNQHDRFENVKDHLLVAKPDNLAGAFVVVLDDIVTSGATFFYANRYLSAAGAAHVHCLALAHSIS